MGGLRQPPNYLFIIIIIFGGGGGGGGGGGHAPRAHPHTCALPHPFSAKRGSKINPGDESSVPIRRDLKQNFFEEKGENSHSKAKVP